ncbi:hypothetical protein BC332_08282 [Capsicum chinense]|nr:hypothetical protein BC332_08282 [Capsicum chinense]
MAESKKEMDGLCVMLSECNLMRNPREWWMDFGATHHVYANKELFAAFALAQGKEKIYMANSATAKVEGTRKVCLKMTSGKVLTLNNILKEEAIDVFRQYKTEVENQLEKKIKTIKNDMLILSRDISDINATKRILESKFDMKDLGVADVILVIRIHRTPQGLALSQSHYIKKVEEQSLGNHPNIHVLLALLWTKFIALDKVDEEAEWLQNFLEDIPYWPKPLAPVCIHCDSQVAIGKGREHDVQWRGRGRPKKYWGEVIRWDMEQLQLTEDMTLDRKEKKYQMEVEKLKEEVVSCKFSKKNDDSTPMAMLELVDTINKFGLSSYFYVQSKVALEKINMCMKSSSSKEEDPYATALCFRLLREHGYHASQGYNNPSTMYNSNNSGLVEESKAPP